jgi:bacillithiol biosynthesis cysteine-adding enzyme BshC
MYASIEPHELPSVAGNRLYLDYLAAVEAAFQFYTHSPHAFAQVLADRKARTYPRQFISCRLAEYNERAGAHARTLANVEALGRPDTWCVIAGQQAGLLGGPAYTAYKIITTIRLAEHLAATYGKTVVPVFWLASEDHDFQEINHAYLVKRDGEIGRVRFRWSEQGRPIADLPITREVERAYGEYWEQIVPTLYTSQVKELFACREAESYCGWQARVWSSLFSSRGLVVVEPDILRAAVPDFFTFALEHVEEIQRRLRQVAGRLSAAGYDPALTSDQAGMLYTFDASGARVRVQNARAHVAAAASHPERYSTDAALRPLLADAALPVLASVLGPGEIAYQGMLKPLYELFELPQPLLYPRQSYTIVAESEAERLAAYRTHPQDVLTESLDSDVVLGDLLPEQERELFAGARRGMERTLAPLREYVEGVDARLARTWEQTLYYAKRSLAKLEERAIKARTNELGFSKGELRRLQNALLPRGRLQERVLPLSHFMNRHGPGFVDALFESGDLGSTSHHVVKMEDEDARSL